MPQPKLEAGGLVTLTWTTQAPEGWPYKVPAVEWKYRKVKFLRRTKTGGYEFVDKDMSDGRYEVIRTAPPHAKVTVHRKRKTKR